MPTITLAGRLHYPEESSCYSTRYVAQHTYVMRPTATNMANEARHRVDMAVLLSPTWLYLYT
jgi:hypothetical protein